MVFKNHLKQFNIPKDFNPGAYRDRPDERDFKYSDVVMGSPQIDWAKGFDVEKELQHDFVTECQGASSSCVGQAWSKYLEVLNFVEEKKFKDLSPRFVYSQIYLPNGGAYIRDGAKIAVGQGDALEETVKSYEYIPMSDGSFTKNPPSEALMRNNSDITDEVRQEALTYQSKEYRSIGPANPDLLAHAILNNWGAVSGATGDHKGWSQNPVQPPSTSDTWGHAFYFKGFGQDSKGKYFDFINSWGNAWGQIGRGRMYYDEYNMAANTYGAWTLVDKPNPIKNMFRIIQEKDDPTRAVWWVGADGKRRFFFNEIQFNTIAPALGIKGGFASLEILSKEDINKIPVDNPLVAIK